MGFHSGAKLELAIKTSRVSRVNALHPPGFHRSSVHTRHGALTVRSTLCVNESHALIRQRTSGERSIRRAVVSRALQASISRTVSRSWKGERVVVDDARRAIGVDDAGRCSWIVENVTVDDY